MCLLTEGFICLLTINFLQMDETDRVPYNFTSSIEDAKLEVKCEYFEDVCSTIVTNMNINSLNLDEGTGPPIFCRGEDLDDGQ